MLSLARDVSWEAGDEAAAVEGVAHAVAAFFALRPLECCAGEDGGAGAAASGASGGRSGGGGGGGVGEQSGGEQGGGEQGGAKARDVEAMDVDGSGSDQAAGGDEGAGGEQQQRQQQEEEDGGRTSTAAAEAGDELNYLGAHRVLAEREAAARNVLFPAMRALLKPQARRARDGSCLLLTSMERLYRVFERCG